VERELSAVQAQLSEAKQNATKTETNLGKITNEKLNLEKENADLKEALEKTSKGHR
jgi:predicted  nucleic acid-binding Zn-ribbon protein